MTNYYRYRVVVVFLLMITGVVTPIHAQQEVSGKYTNSEFGVEIDFPGGDWQGIESTYQDSDSGKSITNVTLMPGGVSPMQAGVQQFQVIVLTISDKLEEEKNAPLLEMPQEADAECKTLVHRNVKLNSMSAIENEMECAGGLSMKVKQYVLATEKKWISVGYVANPASDYGKRIAEFAASVLTLKIENSVEVPEVQLPTVVLPPLENLETVMVTHEDMTFDVLFSLSNGTVENAEVDLDFTSLILTVESSKTDDGELMIILPRGLIDSQVNGSDDEFIIIVNGDETDYRERDTGEAERVLTIPVSAGAEEIEIFGTQVVPEFAFTVLTLMGAIIAIVIALGRLNIPVRV